MKTYAIGVVTKTVAPGDLFIEVYPYSLYPDVNMQDYSSADTIKCHWLREDTNATLTPQFQKGETLEVFRYNDSDYYFAKSIRFEPTLRGQETQTYLWSAIDRKKEPDVVLSAKNSVWLTVDNVNHTIQLHTPAGGASLPGITDEIDLTIDYGNNKITLDNSKSTIILEKDALTVNVKKVTFNGDKFLVKHSDITLEGSTIKIPKGMLTVDALPEFSKKANFKLGLIANAMASVGYHSVVV